MMHERIMKANRWDDFEFEHKQGLDRMYPRVLFLVKNTKRFQRVRKTTFTIINKQELSTVI